MKKKDKRIWLRQIIQIIFLLWLPALFTSAFSAVRYMTGQIRAGEPIEANGFMMALAALCGFTVIFGRYFCGYICAFGSLGDGVYALSQTVQKKAKKKLRWVSEKRSRQMQKLKYLLLIALLFVYGFGLTERFQGSSPWEVFSMLYTGKIPDGSYFLGWLLFVIILFGMCVKERFFCQYLCPMGAVFSWLPVLPFSVLRRDRKQCIPKCRACQMKCPVDLEIEKDQKYGGECIQCLACMDTCPKANIHMGWKGIKGNELTVILLKTLLFTGICFFAGLL